MFSFATELAAARQAQQEEDAVMEMNKCEAQSRRILRGCFLPSHYRRIIDELGMANKDQMWLEQNNPLHRVFHCTTALLDLWDMSVHFHFSHHHVTFAAVQWSTCVVSMCTFHGVGHPHVLML